MPEVSDADVAAMAASAVALKLPTFWPSKPALWFSQIEAQFMLKRITQDVTKHVHLITSLSDDVTTRVSDILISPPETGRYEALKKRLLQTNTLSNDDRAARILDFGPLGADRPSARMDAMLTLIPDEEQPGFLFKEIFLRQFPPEIRSHIKNRDFIDLREIARAADKHWPTDGSSIQALRRPSPSEYITKAMDLCQYHEK
ncbi:Uncharacterized protein FKW44_012789 [Caligus rogercresseyi]|uniref:DUF7041 domain-containing protein n=1 Tax=Caligus rogercresseyi TaxID=217165 RepID=A0A7T8HK64_CALRO|nr:Uncharacterized protein FKW44_012789 [Caligus rogercresseyi]